MSSKIEISGITELSTAEVQQLHDQLQQRYDAAMTVKNNLEQRVTTMCDRLRAIIAVEKEVDPKLTMALSFILRSGDHLPRRNHGVDGQAVTVE